MPLGSSPAQIGHGEDFSRMDLHDDRRAPDGVLGFELAPQRLVGDVLQVQIERGHHVVAVYRGPRGRRPRRGRRSLWRCVPQGFAVAARKLFAVGLPRCRNCPCRPLVRSWARQFALRVDPLVAFDEPVDHAHIPVQQRITPRASAIRRSPLHGEDIDGRGRGWCRRCGVANSSPRRRSIRRENHPRSAGRSCRVR